MHTRPPQLSSGWFPFDATDSLLPVVKCPREMVAHRRGSPFLGRAPREEAHPGQGRSPSADSASRRPGPVVSHQESVRTDSRFPPPFHADLLSTCPCFLLIVRPTMRM